VDQRIADVERYRLRLVLRFLDAVLVELAPARIMSCCRAADATVD
jgi:hypothetical protein